MVFQKLIDIKEGDETMTVLKSVIEILQLLDKSNCKKCGEKTCMAFAGSVLTGKKKIMNCPAVDRKIAALYEDVGDERQTRENELEEAIVSIRKVIKKMNFPEVAKRVHGLWNGEKLTIKIMGKDFSFDEVGEISTNLHINSWVVISGYNYVVNCKGIPVKGKWKSLRELPGGKDWYRFFSHQCEKPLKKIMDEQTDLLEDIVTLFSGEQLSHEYESDIAVMLSPFPLVPMLICYWKPEDGMGSSMNLFFDETAEDNLSIEGLYMLVTGIVRMFEKLAQQHGSLAHGN